LTSIAALGTGANKMIYTTGVDTAAEADLTPFARTLLDDANAATARATLDVDQAGTDNSTNVTLAGTPDYITISGQEITRNLIDLLTDVENALPIANGGSGQTTQQAAIDTLTAVVGATNEHVLTKDTASGNAIFKAAVGFDLTIDTRTNILASTPADPSIAFASDTGKFYLYDDSVWKQAEIKMTTDLEAPDMGYEKQSAPQGYGLDYITDKKLSNVLLGGNAREENGAIRVDVTQDPDTFEIYLRGLWQTILYDLTIENNEFEHTPISEVVDVWSGNSNLLGLTGLPVVQQYKTSMGAYPPPRIIDGGTF